MKMFFDFKGVSFRNRTQAIAPLLPSESDDKIAPLKLKNIYHFISNWLYIQPACNGWAVFL